MHNRIPVALMMAVVGLIVTPMSGAGQSAALGLSGSIGLVVGGASDLLDVGYGAQLSGQYRLGTGPVSVRVSGEWLGLERGRDPVSGNTASNGLITILAGPEVAVPIGRFTPFGYGSAGFTTNRLHATSGTVTTVKASSSVFAWSAGAGLRVRLTSGRRPVELEVSTHLLRTGTLDFARVNQAPRRFADGVAVLGLRAGVRIGL